MYHIYLYVTYKKLWSGHPAVFVRKLSTEEIESIKRLAEKMHILATKYDFEDSKTFFDLDEDRAFNEEFIPNPGPKYHTQTPPIKQT